MIPRVFGPQWQATVQPEGASQTRENRPLAQRVSRTADTASSRQGGWAIKTSPPVKGGWRFIWSRTYWVRAWGRSPRYFFPTPILPPDSWMQGLMRSSPAPRAEMAEHRPPFRM